MSVSNCFAFATAFDMRCRIRSMRASVRALRRDIRVTARAAVTIAACIGDFLVDFADLEICLVVVDMEVLYPIRPFPSSPFVNIFSNIFCAGGTGGQESVTLGARAGGLSRAGGGASAGVDSRAGVGRRAGERGRGRQESVTQQCPAASGSHPRQTLAWVPYRLCLLFNSPTHTPPTPLIGSPVRIPHQQKFFNINTI